MMEERAGQARGWVGFVIGDAVSTVGDALFNVTAMWVVYRISGSSLETGIIQILWQTPPAVFGGPAGVWVDRRDPKAVLVLSNVSCGVVVGLLGVATLASGAVSVAGVLAVVFVLNLLVTVMSPARYAMVPRLVRGDRLGSFNGFLSMVRNGGSLTGSAAAGVLLATVGRTWGMLGDALSFLAGGVLLGATLPNATGKGRNSQQAGRSWWEEMTEAASWIRKEPTVRVFVVVLTLGNVASFAGPLYPALVRLRLGAGPGSYGAIEACGVAGAMLGGALCGPLQRRLGARRLMVGALWVAGLCLLGVGGSVWVPVTAALELVYGFAVTPAFVGASTVTQLLVPAEMRGRVGGLIRALSAAVIPASTLLGGWLADVVGPAPVVAAGGVWIVGVGVVALTSRGDPPGDQPTAGRSPRTC